MAKKVNRTLIGAFVLGAIVLVVAGVMVFGSGKFFAKTNTYVMFFEGSVKGLNVGSPVVFRGVKIGEVTNVRLIFDPAKLSALIAVYAEVDPESWSVPVSGEEEKAMREKSATRLIAAAAHRERAESTAPDTEFGDRAIDGQC
jgi:paraquat-inducible protein B